MKSANERARTTATLMVLAVLSGACSAGVTELDRETEAPLQTDRLTYNLRHPEGGSDAPAMVVIPFTYRNDTGQTVFQLSFCGTPVRPTVFRATEAGWIPAMNRAVNDCLSVTGLPIPPGHTYEDTVRFRPAPDLLGSRSVSGVYRLSWAHWVVHDFHEPGDANPGDYGVVLPEEETVSNRFRVLEP